MSWAYQQFRPEVPERTVRRLHLNLARPLNILKKKREFGPLPVVQSTNVQKSPSNYIASWTESVCKSTIPTSVYYCCERCMVCVFQPASLLVRGQLGLVRPFSHGGGRRSRVVVVPHHLHVVLGVVRGRVGRPKARNKGGGRKGGALLSLRRWRWRCRTSGLSFSLAKLEQTEEKRTSSYGKRRPVWSLRPQHRRKEECEKITSPLAFFLASC